MEKDLYMLEMKIYDKELYILPFIRFTYQKPSFDELIFTSLTLSKDERINLSYALVSCDKEELENKIPKFIENNHYLNCPTIARVFIGFLYHLKVSLEWRKEFRFNTIYTLLEKVRVSYTKIEDSDFV